MYKKMWGEGVVGVVNPICAVQEGTYGIRSPTAPLPSQISLLDPQTTRLPSIIVTQYIDNEITPRIDPPLIPRREAPARLLENLTKVANQTFASICTSSSTPTNCRNKLQ